MHKDLYVDVNRKPLSKVTKHLLQSSGFVHSPPLFLQVTCPSIVAGEPPTYEKHDLSVNTVLTIGTANEAQVQIHDHNSSAAGTVEAKHAKIYNHNGCSYIQDLATKAGTFLCLGRARGGRKAYALCAGDEFHLSPKMKVLFSSV